MSIPTKADLEARIAQLETQLATSPAADPKAAGMVRLVGMLKAVKDISREGGKRTICAILTNTSSERLEGQEVRVDLPVDGILATDNGSPIATDIFDLAQSTNWARVAISGYWTSFGELALNPRGFHFAQRRQLRAMRLEVLNAEPIGQTHTAPARPQPTSEEVPF